MHRGLAKIHLQHAVMILHIHSFIYLFFICLFISHNAPVTAKVRARVVTVEGPRGKLVRNFRHMAIVIKKEGKKTIKVDKWFGNRKQLAAVRTVCSHIQNMIKGVTLVSKPTVKFKHNLPNPSYFVS